MENYTIYVHIRFGEEIDYGVPLKIGVTETQIKHIIVENNYCGYEGTSGRINNIKCEGKIVKKVEREHNEKFFEFSLRSHPSIIKHEILEINYSNVPICPINVYLYFRVSTKAQKEKENLQSQMLQAREYCKNNGYNICGEFSDVGTSTYNDIKLPNRDIVVKLSEMNKTPIMVTEIDRFTRNPQYYDDTVGNKRVRVIPIDNPTATIYELRKEVEFGEIETRKIHLRENRKLEYDNYKKRHTNCYNKL